MEEILASIRKIISDEPTGGSSARPRPSDRPSSVLPTGTTVSPPRPSERDAAPGSLSASRAAPQQSAPGKQQSASQVFGASGRAVVPPPPPGPQGSNQLLGRLSEALGRTVSSPPTTQPKSSGVSPAARAPGRNANLDELAEILADAVHEKPSESNSASAVDTDGKQARDAGDNASFKAATSDSGDVDEILNLDFDFDETSKSRPEADEDAKSTDAPQVFGGASDDAKQLHKSANAVAFDRMLTARRGDSKADATESGSSDPQPGRVLNGSAVIASSPSLAPPEAKPTQHFIPAGDQDEKDENRLDAPSETPVADADFDDPEASAAAKSAFGALMAGLAASSSPDVGEGSTDASGGGDKQPEANSQSELRSIEARGDEEKTAVDDGEQGDLNGEGDAAPLDAAPLYVLANTDLGDDKVGSRADAGAGAEEPAPNRPKVVVADVTIGVDRDALQPKPAQRAGSAANGRDALAAHDGEAVIAPGQSAQEDGLAATLGGVSAMNAVGVRTVEDIVAELLRPMLRDWLAENMPRMVEKALRIELAEGLKTINPPAPVKVTASITKGPTKES